MYQHVIHLSKTQIIEMLMTLNKLFQMIQYKMSFLKCHLQINQLGFQLDLKKKDAFKTNIKQHKTHTIITRFKGINPLHHHHKPKNPLHHTQAQVAAPPPPSGAKVPMTLPSTAQVSSVGPTSQGKQR